ncbi:MAG: extracellular solute-binding protein [Chloroflexi bacterium]|nr:extracellular solute-binding protein [Chloroflexota bacterium]
MKTEMMGTGVTRRQVMAVGSGVAAVWLAACDAGRAGEPGAAPAGKAPVTLTYISPTSVERQQGEQELFGDVSRELPHITVEVSGAGNWDQTKEKALISHAAGTPIHFVQAGWGTWLDMWGQGAIVELSAYFKRDKIDMAGTFIDPAIFQWQHDGKVGGMPITTSADALAYNVDLFNAAGLRLPPVDTTASWWNMDTFLEYAKKLTDRGKMQFGFGGGFAGANTGGFTTGTYFGQGSWDDVKKKCLMDTPLFQKGLQFWKDVRDVHRVQPTGEESNQIRGGASGNVFFTGKVGMQVLLITQAALPFKWAVATLPYSGPAGSKNVSARIHNHSLLMGKTKDNEREATWQVFRWLLKPENAGRFQRTAGHVVSPLKNPAASEVSQKRYRDQLGVDPKAYLLQAQTTRPSGWGMSKYANFAQVGKAIDERYNKEFLADKLGVKEYATWVTKYVDDNLGAAQK